MFELNGIQYSLEELQQAAKNQNLEFEEFMEKMRAKGLVEAGEQQAKVVEEQETEVVEEQETFEDPFLQSAKKIYGPVEEVAVAEPTTTIEQPDTELPLEDTSLDLPEVENEVVVTGDASKIKKPAEILLGSGAITPETFKELETDEIIPMIARIIQPNSNLSVYEQDNRVFIKDKKTDTAIGLSTKTNFANEKDAEISYNNFARLLNKNFTPEQVSASAGALSEVDQELKKQSAIIKNQFKNTEEYKKLKDPDLFKEQIKKDIRTGPGGGVALTKKVIPYEEEVQAEIAKLKVKNPDTTEDKILATAQANVRENLLQNAKFEYVAESFTKKIEGFDVDKKLKKKVQADYNIALNRANAYQQALLDEIEGQRQVADTTLKLIKGNELTQEEVDNLATSLEKSGVEVDTSKTKTVTLPSGAVLTEGTLEALDKFQKKAAANEILLFKSQEEKAKAIGDITLTQAALDATKRDYDLIDKYGASIGLGFTDIITGGAYLGGKVFSYSNPIGWLFHEDINTGLNRLGVKYKKATDEVRNSYVRDISFDNAFKDSSNFGKFVGQEIANQLPIITTMIASGGTAAPWVIGASTAGGKMMDMQTEIATGTKDYSEAEMWLKSIGYGAAEGIFGTLPTMRILKRTPALFKGAGTKDAILGGTKQFYKQNTKGLISDTLLEVGGESLTTGFQNVIDGRSFVADMDHAAFSAFGFSLLFSGLPFAVGLNTSKYGDYSQKAKIRNLQGQINNLSNNLKYTKSPAEQSRIEGQIEKLSNEMAIEVARQEKFVNNYMTSTSAQHVIDVVTRQENIRSEAITIEADKQLSKQEKNTRLGELQLEFSELQSSKESALTDAAKMNFKTEFLLLKGVDKAKYDEYFDDAATLLNSQKPDKNITDEAIEQKAVDLYFEDQVIEENNKATKNLGTNFKSFNTVDEAIASIEADNKINDADKKDAIANLKEGDDGRAFQNEDGSKVTYAVVENQVLNKRKYIRTHEVGHQVFWDIFGSHNTTEGKAIFNNISEQLLHTTKEISPTLHKKLSQETLPVEVIARFLEAVGAGQVDTRKPSTNKALSGLFGTMLQQNATDSYDFNFTGETDMFNFVVGLGKKIASGDLSMADIRAARTGRVVQMPAQAKQTTLTRQAASARSAGTLDQALNKFSQNEDGSAKFASKEEWRKSSEAGEAYFTVQQTGLLDGEIRKQARLKGLPEDIDISEIKDNIALRVFENYDPSKNNLFGYLLGKVNIVEKAVLDSAKKFGTRVESTAASIDTAAGETGAVAELEAGETTVEEKIEREAKEATEEASMFNLTTSKAIEPTTLEKGKGKVLSIVRTLKNKLGAAVSKNVNTVPVVEEVIQSSAKSIDIDIKGQMGGKGGLKLRKFVINNKADIINNASSTWLMGKNKKGSSVVNGGIPIVIEKSVGGRYTGKTIEINVGGKTVTVEEFIPNFLPYPEWAGKKIDREKTIKRGQTSGNQIVRKVDPLEVDDKAFADFVTTENGTPIRGRKESLANELAGRLGGQIFKEAIADPDSDISKAFEQNQDLRGAVLSDNFRNEVIEQTERGLIARSAGVDALTQEMNTIIKDVFDRKSYKSMGEALGRLETIKGEFQELKLTPEIKESVNTISRIIQDIVWGEKNRGVQAEIEMVDAIKKAAKITPGLYINPNFNPAGTKGGVPDIVFYVDGKKITLENKLTIYSQIKALPALSITEDGIAPIKTSDAELDSRLNNAVKNHKPLQKLVKLLAEDARGKYSTLRTGRKTIRIKKSEGVGGQQQGFYWQAENLVKNEFGENNFELKVKGTIKDLNTILGKNNFQTNEIHFMDVGLVQLSEFSKLNTPNKLNLDDTVDIRFVVYRNASTDSNGNIKHYNLTIKPTFLLSEASRTKVSASETVNFVNPGDISKATKNTYNNNATQAASKGKAQIETLNKQYDEHQKSLNARSKGKLSPEFNRIIERASGIGARKKLSAVVARKMGKNKGMFKLFLPPSAEDFRGLYYMMIGKGRQGETDKKFFKENLVKPYTRGVASMEKAKQALLNDYKTLRKAFKQGFKDEGIKMKQEIPGTKLSVEQAMRVYLWSNSDMEIPGLTAADQKKALEYVYKNPAVQAYADSLLAISKQEQWSQPTEYWDAQSILSDLTDIALNVNRKKYLEGFIANKNEIFSEDNLNKVEATYGKEARQAIEDIMYRMETGSNKPSGGDTIAKKWNNWLNNSVGAIMFFNRRSATLQLLSTVNFMNTGDNNPLKAGLAFANQPQYWKDWAMIFNSPKLKERRGGLKSDVQEAEIAAAAKGAKNKPLAIISYLLKIGFTPTQIADSVAIASGGSAFYRNRVNTYKKQGFEQAEAEAKAFEDFSEISDETQQSGDPMLISKQQASLMGRVILAFQNTPMQITRFQKRDFQDLINRRRIEGKSQFQSDATYLSRIAYYTAVQNLIFSTLQNGLFTLLPGFGDEDEEGLSEKEIEKLQKKDEQKVQNVLNSMLDTTLRGSGLYGAVASTIKNVIIEYMRQQEKDPFSKDNTRVLLQAINLSPPLGSKARKIYNGLETMDYEKDVIKERGFGVKIDGKFQLSPSYQVLGNLTSAATNLPLDRVVSELDVVSEALDSRNTEMQRLALALGWKSWEVGAEIEEHEAIKTTAKATRKAEGIEKRKQKSAEKRKIETDAIQSMSNKEINAYADWKTKNKGKRLYDYLKETNQL